MDLRFHALTLLPKDAPIELPELARVLGCHTATIKRNVKRGVFPSSFKGLGGKSTWIVGDLLNHLRTLAQHAAQGSANLNSQRVRGA